MRPSKSVSDLEVSSVMILNKHITKAEPLMGPPLHQYRT
jgi:hypothetical protein